jgi:hypothetical protein
MKAPKIYPPALQLQASSACTTAYSPIVQARGPKTKILLREELFDARHLVEPSFAAQQGARHERMGPIADAGGTDPDAPV